LQHVTHFPKSPSFRHGFLLYSRVYNISGHFETVFRIKIDEKFNGTTGRKKPPSAK